MRGQVMQHMLHSDDTAAMHRYARVAMAVMAAGMVGVVATAGAQQVAMSQTAFRCLRLRPRRRAASTASAPAAGASGARDGADHDADFRGAAGDSGDESSRCLGWHPGGDAGTGPGAGKLIFSHLGVRAGINLFNYGVNNSVSDVSYDARLRFQNIPVMLDLSRGRVAASTSRAAWCSTRTG